MSRAWAIALLLILAAAGCTPTDEAAASQDGALSGTGASLGTDYYRVSEIAESVYVYEFAPAGDPVTTVSLFVVTGEGVLVADGQGDPEETGKLIDAIRQVTETPITHVVIASDHGDHTGGNGAFPEGVVFIAHPAADRALRATARPPDRAADAPPVVLPGELVEEERVLELGSREIRILFLGRGHTAGDLVVHLPDSGIAFMSEAYNDRVFPLLRSGYPSEWLASLAAAESLAAEQYVAGHGVRGSTDYTRAGLLLYRDALERVIAEARRLHALGLTPEQAAEQADFGELEQWADHDSQAPRAVQRVFMELNGELP